MLGSDPVIKKLSSVQARQSIMGRRLACQIVRDLISNMYLRVDSKLVNDLLNDDWASVTDFFARVEQKREVSAFDANAPAKFADTVRTQMSMHGLRAADLQGRQPAPRWASLSPEPRPIRQSDGGADLRFLCVGIAALVVLAVGGAFLVSLVGGMRVVAPAEKVQEPTLYARFEAMERVVADLKADNDVMKDRLKLQETGSAAAEVLRSRALEEALAAHGRRQDDQISAFLVNTRAVLDGVKKESAMDLKDMRATVKSLETRVGESRVMLESYETRLRNAKNEMDANMDGVAKMSEAVKSHLGEVKDLWKEINKTKDSHQAVLQEQRAASEHLRSNQMILWNAVAVIFIICALTSLYMYASVMCVDRVRHELAEFKALTASHQRLSERVDAIVAEQEQTAVLDDVPAPPGPGGARRRRGRAD